MNMQIVNGVVVNLDTVCNLDIIAIPIYDNATVILAREIASVIVKMEVEFVYTLQLNNGLKLDFLKEKERIKLEYSEDKFNDYDLNKRYGGSNNVQIVYDSFRMFVESNNGFKQKLLDKFNELCKGEKDEKN
jgi:hypothetical protein